MRVAPAGNPLKTTPASPGGSPIAYVMPAAGDGPRFVNVTVAATCAPATADAGAAIVVVTSATGETAVLDVAESGSVFAPCAVVVPIALDTTTDPDAGALNVSPTDSVVPDVRLVGIPEKVMPPVAGSYVAVAPAGSPVTTTPVNPGAMPSE